MVQDMEEAKKATETPLKSPPVTTSTTPDYAAGFNATTTPAPITTPAAFVVIISQTPVKVTTTPPTMTMAVATPQFTTFESVSPLIMITPTKRGTAVVTEQSSAEVPTDRVLLTREQMLDAQDMLRTANKVTRAEKVLILGFMAGSCHHNPCPHLGNIITIKLSENQEKVLQPDETFLTMVAETHFQMNYNNGEWKRIKKYRHIGKCE